jgi:signal transduction histidine kinase
LLNIIEDNETIPTILVDDDGNIVTTRNLDPKREKDTVYINQTLEIMKNEHVPIKILYDEENKRYNYLYYENSKLLNELKTYPFIQLALIGFFALMSYFALSSSRKAEQNQVWVGMSKETAHQLGTPISSLREWLNLIRETDKDQQEEILQEFDYDIKRLELITERFSKIGSEPKLENKDVVAETQKSYDYLQSRFSKQVEFSFRGPKVPIVVLMNSTLHSWTIENLVKNAIDAMKGKGKLDLEVLHEGGLVKINVTDTGNGIPKNQFKTVFEPGFTTKKRGWGLGLSLTKRIVEEYHKGTIKVLHSEIGKGTTMQVSFKVSELI